MCVPSSPPDRRAQGGLVEAAHRRAAGDEKHHAGRDSGQISLAVILRCPRLRGPRRMNGPRTRAVALRGPREARPPQGDGGKLEGASHPHPPITAPKVASSRPVARSRRAAIRPCRTARTPSHKRESSARSLEWINAPPPRAT